MEAGAHVTDGAPAARSSAVVAPTAEDGIVRSLSRAVGGPPGRRARPHRFWTPVRVLVLLAVAMSLLGWAQKAPCRYHPWENGYQYTRLCYSDVYALYFAEGLDQSKVPYVDTPVEYPVGIGVAMRAGSVVAHLFPGADRPAAFYDLTALALAVCAVGITVFTSLTAGRRRPWDAALFVLAPTLLLHMTTNWDLLAVAFASAGLFAWSRRSPGIAGLLWGFGAATKLYPVLFLVPVALLCLRTGQLARLRRAVLACVAAILVVYIPGYVASPAFAGTGTGANSVIAGPSAWQELRDGGDWVAALAPHHDGGTNGTLRFLTLNETRPADWDSLFYALQVWQGHPLDQGRAADQAPRILNTLTGLGFLVGLAGVAWLALRARRRPRLPALLFLTLLAFLLPSKVFSPQYVLWLVPLVALTRPRWGLFLGWQASEAFLLLMRYLHFVQLDDASAGVDVSWFIASVIIRDGFLVALAVLTVRDILRPERDVVRASGVDDPAGGILDGAPDAPRWERAPTVAEPARS